MENNKLNYDIVLKPILTEKSYQLISESKYTFEVAKDATKTEVKTAIEKLFNVKVKKVNIMNVKSKPKKMGRFEGYTRGWKKAIVTLAQGYVIKELQGNV